MSGSGATLASLATETLTVEPIFAPDLVSTMRSVSRKRSTKVSGSRRLSSTKAETSNAFASSASGAPSISTTKPELVGAMSVGHPGQLGGAGQHQQTTQRDPHRVIDAVECRQLSPERRVAVLPVRDGGEAVADHDPVDAAGGDGTGGRILLALLPRHLLQGDRADGADR